MRFLVLDAQSLNVKERHVILPLVIETFIMQSIAFIIRNHKFVQRLFSVTLKDHTYLRVIFIALCADNNFKDLIQSICRYSGLS